MKFLYENFLQFYLLALTSIIQHLTNLATPQWASVGFIFYCFLKNFFGRKNKFQTCKKN
ncbi:hypothetical protein [Spiroplasma endosymbiont of Nomada rufipes]|uniref:hypothetical protein n=1 Tax=Spiroplasma endosymbiont of Nomada rufipes TaxID=3077933 RepID=UPI00376F3F05